MEVPKILQSKNEKKIINWVFKKYFQTLYFAAIKVKQKYPNTPIEYEDLVNCALFECPKIIKNFDKERNVKFESYLSLQVFYFMANYIRKFTSKNNTIMNLYVNFDDVQNQVFTLEDSEQEKTPASKQIATKTNTLSTFEYDVYVLYFLTEKSLKQTASKLNTSSKAIANAVFRIRKKLR